MLQVIENGLIVHAASIRIQVRSFADHIDVGNRLSEVRGTLSEVRLRQQQDYVGIADGSLVDGRVNGLGLFVTGVPVLVFEEPVGVAAGLGGETLLERHLVVDAARIVPCNGHPGPVIDIAVLVRLGEEDIHHLLRGSSLVPAADFGGSEFAGPDIRLRCIGRLRAPLAGAAARINQHFEDALGVEIVFMGFVEVPLEITQGISIRRLCQRLEGLDGVVEVLQIDIGLADDGITGAFGRTASHRVLDRKQGCSLGQVRNGLLPDFFLRGIGQLEIFRRLGSDQAQRSGPEFTGQQMLAETADE